MWWRNLPCSGSTLGLFGALFMEFWRELFGGVRDYFGGDLAGLREVLFWGPYSGSTRLFKNAIYSLFND